MTSHGWRPISVTIQPHERRDPAGEREARRRPTAASAARRAPLRVAQVPIPGEQPASARPCRPCAEREEERRDRRAIRLEGVDALHLARRIVREDQAARVRNLDREVVALRPSRSGSRRARAACSRSVFQSASIAAIFAGWCSSVFRPCWSPTKICTGASIAAASKPGAQRAPRAARPPAPCSSRHADSPAIDERRGEARGEQHVRQAVRERRD